MIGGNIEAILQVNTESETNRIGETVQNWTDTKRLYGWLDYSGGDARYTYDAKMRESTHLFMCDYTPIDTNPTDKRLVIDGKVYEVLMIDDPMNLHHHIEITLKYTGWLNE